ncbi:response regulator [Stakelama saccharophila]|uniref:Response regulator n=1 Tax=Stakelama saccharophila TaxID=3075605 RepID=A0ABZ0B5X1_9SPHN|nr:response regulator [Stakelama sp. W311]WNO52405.1 response regulator [Stakelama sp. W311]
MREQCVTSTDTLEGKRVLVVEDEYFVADDLRRGLVGAGVVIVGPVADIDQALKAAEREDVDAALLDINLGGEMSFPVADRLSARRIPFVLTTGYDDWTIPERFRHARRLGKPFSVRIALDCLRQTLTSRQPENA